MKSIIFIITVSFCLVSCGKKYDYVCVSRSNDPKYTGVVVPDYHAKMTDAEARRYERTNSINSDGNDYVVSHGEYQTVCTK